MVTDNGKKKWSIWQVPGQARKYVGHFSKCLTDLWFDCYGTVSSILLLNTDLAVAPLSLASPGILAPWKFD